MSDAEGKFPPADPPQAPPTRPGELRLRTQRATWPTVLGIIAVVLAALGIVSRLGSLGMLLLMRSMFAGMDDEFHPATAGPFSDQWLAWTVVEYSLGAGLAIWLLLAGIGLLQRRRWSPLAINFWAWSNIVFLLGEAILRFFVQRDQLAALQQRGGAGPGAMTLSLIFATLPWLLIGLAFPVVCLIVLNLASSRREVETWR